LNKVKQALGGSIHEVLKIEGNVRPGKEKGHEHFGFLDGVSLPAVEALMGPHLPGQQVVNPGVVICGQPGDGNLSARPPWAKNGSFLVYRHLEQLVPEFNTFLFENPIDLPDLPRDKGSELMGARLVGRWKSGAPIDLSPTQDDPALAADPQRNNNFTFRTTDEADQSRCPFAAHIRKTNPRADLIDKFGEGSVANHSIMRAGIPFGPEVTNDEAQSGRTRVSRGLSFVCYQSKLADGFEFIQKTWVNNVTFPPKTVNGQRFESGHDPLIGQTDAVSRLRRMRGTDPRPEGQDDRLGLPDEFVVSKGGAYFFVPSISALSKKFSV